jgi:DNA (cytosine-5)-methyltransferase 1
MECRWQVEIDPWCRRVLTKHWPDIPKFSDIRELTGKELVPVDLIAGGFPCQPVSVAGRGRAQADERWLWPELLRIVRSIRPSWVLVENVPGLFNRGFETVLRDLAGSGYDAEWSIVSACQVGAPQMRKRLFILAHARSLGIQPGTYDTLCPRREELELRSWWQAEPDVVRVADGVSAGVDRIRGLGNAVVPQVAEWVGRRIIAHDRSGVDDGPDGFADERTGVRRPSAGRLPWS